MLVIHVHVKGPQGHIQKTYDFLRYDGKEALGGMDVVIPFDKDIQYPLNESEVMTLLSNKELRGDH